MYFKLFTVYLVLQDKLAKEEKNAKFNLNKLQNQWRVIMRESMSTSVRSAQQFNWGKDIHILQQLISFEIGCVWSINEYRLI